MCKKLEPKYQNISEWESYSQTLLTEYRQSIDEGLDIEKYESLFKAVHEMPRGESKEKMADILFDIVLNANIREGYKYNEPSALEEIKKLRKEYKYKKNTLDEKALKSKIQGAWYGRVIGCLLGKPIECAWTEDIHEILKSSGNYPMSRYILSTDIPKTVAERSPWLAQKGRCYADNVSYMPFDDDTNYVVLAQEVVEKYGRDFTALDMSRAWMDMQPKNAYCTAERVAFRNFVNGFEPPESAMYKNAYREWIGAQIRGDYFGYINPGNTELAADMAFRDASISHTKNGIYGEMFASAMIAAAAVTDDIKDIIRAGLAEIPAASRLYEAIEAVLSSYEGGASFDEQFESLNKAYDYKYSHDWCHTISNAIIVVTALLYGEGDFGKSICLAVQQGFDTDCNGATVGSIIGIRNGIEKIDDCWKKPINDTLETTIFGVGMVNILERAEKTLAHMQK